MPKKRYTPEEIVAKLRQVDVLVCPSSKFLRQRAVPFKGGSGSSG
jgi:hypothetical protein